MKTLALTLAALIAAALAAAPATAQSPDQPRIVVRYADLDLATAQGRATLDLRLLHAARTACGTPSPTDLRGQGRLDACVAEIRAAAAAQRDAAVSVAFRRAPPALAGR
jgi:UrcA family protein